AFILPMTIVLPQPREPGEVHEPRTPAFCDGEAQPQPSPTRAPDRRDRDLAGAVLAHPEDLPALRGGEPEHGPLPRGAGGQPRRAARAAWDLPAGVQRPAGALRGDR